MKKRSILLVIIFFISIIILSVNSNNKYLVNKESLATYIDGEKTDSFPAKGTVAFSKADCDNNTNIYWDNDNWGLYVTNLNEKTKCNLYFKTLENAVTKITNLASTDSVNMASDDPDNNIRYIGANPNNYIYFNCDDYNNQTSDTCELWRIIGVFNNIEKEDGTRENLIKIIRNESIGDYSWDNKDTTSGAEHDYGKNDWTTARLNYLLNPGHESETSGGSLYYNAKKGNCYYEFGNKTISCDFTLRGLKNDVTRNNIESVLWNLGGISEYSTAISQKFYNDERNSEVFSGRLSVWTGKIALIYPSDYGYATSGGVTIDRQTCLKKELYNWYDNSMSDCINNNYLYNSNIFQYTLSHYNKYSYDIYIIDKNGSVHRSSAGLERTIKPTLFLKSNISIGIGDGSSTNPYQLNL